MNAIIAEFIVSRKHEVSVLSTILIESTEIQCEAPGSGIRNRDGSPPARSLSRIGQLAFGGFFFFCQLLRRGIISGVFIISGSRVSPATGQKSHV